MTRNKAKKIISKRGLGQQSVTLTDNELTIFQPQYDTRTHGSFEGRQIFKGVEYVCRKLEEIEPRRIRTHHGDHVVYWAIQKQTVLKTTKIQ